MRLVIVGITLLLATTLVLTACGGSSRPPRVRHPRHPTALQEAARFVTAYVDHGCADNCAKGLHAYGVDGSISRIDPRWARFTLQADTASGQPVDGAVMVLFRKSTGWSVFAGPGGGPMGCGVPKAVRKELSLVATPACVR